MTKFEIPSAARRIGAALVSAALLGVAAAGGSAVTATSEILQPTDVFELEYATDPQLAPGGDSMVYVRNFFDKTSDRRRSNLWTVDVDGSRHRPLTTGDANDRAPRWSPDGSQMVYVSDREGGNELWLRYSDTGQLAKLTRLEGSPGAPAWSRDGRWLAFTMFVREEGSSFTQMPKAPHGADWAPVPKVIDTLTYRSDGAGYLERGNRQLFVLPAGGGTARQVTSGRWDVGGFDWTPEGGIVLSSNRREDAEYEPNDSDLWALDLATLELTRLTERAGPDGSPSISPDGRWIAYTGFVDEYLGYHNSLLTVRERRSPTELGPARELTSHLDRSIDGLHWSADSASVVVRYDDIGLVKLAQVDLDGELFELTGEVGGTSLGRPYSSGAFDVGVGGAIAYTHSRTDRPADLGYLPPASDGRRGQAAKPTPRVLTSLNEDLLAHKRLGVVEEIWAKSSHDGLSVQGWIVKPPGFEEGKDYPLILEIHGGPFATYGPFFSAEVQLYAAAGYVVLYTNPRGSTSYGADFANEIHHNYPNHDYDDLMSLVDATVEKGYVDPQELYVTGGSGGGVLTAWIVGHTDRFHAAVSAKPVINWTSFVYTADNPAFFARYWFGKMPWEDPEAYHRRSPLSYVGNVTTPTMLLTGEQDWRTPISESEQFYTALKLRKVPSALVRIPEASHGIAARPSHLMAKVLYILEWFERFGPQQEAGS